jgi:hypothetical protein
MNENSYRTIKSLLASIALAIVALFLFVTVASHLSAQRLSDNQYFCNGAPINIKEGDTLYWIVRNNCDGNFVNALDEVVSFYGTTLQVGNTIYLPTHFPCKLRFTDGGQVIEDC